MFFVTWRGRGLWVLYGPFLGATLTVLLFWGLKQTTGALPAVWFRVVFLALLSLLLPGLALVILGVRARLQPPRMVLEPETGREIQQRRVHSLYGIPVQYWGAVLLVWGAWVCTLRPSPSQFGEAGLLNVLTQNILPKSPQEGVGATSPEAVAMTPSQSANPTASSSDKDETVVTNSETQSADITSTEAGAPQGQRIRVPGTEQAGKLTAQTKPVYPPLARQAGIQGAVRLQAVIGKDGTVENLEVVAGHPLLISAALQAVKKWRYQPTVVNGSSVEVITTIDVNFTLPPSP